MIKKLAFFILNLALVSAVNLAAQRVVSDRYSYRYVMSDTETVKQAEVNAVRQAQLGMIARHFGTMVGATTALTISDNVSSLTYGETEVRGIWLEDLAAPVINKMVQNGHFVLEVIVSGKIKEYSSTPIDLKCEVLKNGTDLKYASTEFIHGDRLYLSFKTPVDGYLAVYLSDRETANCLFPYNGLPADIMKVNADEEYVFFSRSKPGKFDPFSIQEYPLGCSPGTDMEMVRLYVIFSPNKFVKASDNAEGRLRTLPFEDFHSWLSKIRRIDSDMNLLPYDIAIRRK